MNKMRKIYIIISICLTLILTFQTAVFAGKTVEDAGKAIVTAIVVVAVVVGTAGLISAGSALVAGGAAQIGATAGGAIVATGPTGAQLITGIIYAGGGAAVAKVGIDLLNDGGGGGGGGNTGWPSPTLTPIPTPPDPKTWQITVQINDTGDKAKKVAVIQIKDAAGAYITPPSDYPVYVSHSNSQVNMALGGASSFGVKAESIDTSSYVSIKDVPNLTVSGIPNIIKYALQKQSQLTRLEVLNSAGSVVYALSESMPNPSMPIPFVWSGKDMNGSSVAPGAYSVRIKAVKDDGSAEYSPISVMSVANSIPAENEQQITFDSENKAYVTFFNVSSSSATDFIYVKLKDSSGNAVSEVPTVSKAVVFGGFDSPQLLAKEYTLPNIARFDSTVDSIPLRIEMPGTNASDFGKFNLVFYPEDSSKQCTYSYNSANDEITASDSKGVANRFDEGTNGNEYAVALSIFNYYARRMFEKSGYSIDVKTGTINVDSSVRGHNVVVQSEGEKITVNVDGMDYQYDSSKGTVMTSDTVTWGESAWASLGGGVKSSGVMAMADNTVPSIANLIVLEAICLKRGEFKAALKIYYYMQKVASGDKFKPLDKPVLPEITEAVPNSDFSRVALYGKGRNNSDMKVVVNDSEVKSVQWPSSSDTWEIKDIPLYYGMNKIYVRADSKYEGIKVKSKTITAVRAGGGSGYGVSMALITPSEGYVIGCDFPLDNSIGFNPNSYYVEAKTKIKGRAESDATLYVGNNNIMLNSNGEFDVLIGLILHEGENVVSIRSTKNGGATDFPQKVIGALRFTQYNSNTKQNEKYIIQPGDFLFNEDTSFLGKIIIPLFPDHAGTYIGGGRIVEAIYPNLVNWALYDDPTKANKNSFYGKNRNFYGATRVPYFDEDISNGNQFAARTGVANITKDQVGKNYDIPIKFNLFPAGIYGKYNGGENGFYCSELAYWSWEQIIKTKINDYIPLQKVLFPMNDKDRASLLPSLLYLNSWGVDCEN